MFGLKLCCRGLPAARLQAQPQRLLPRLQVLARPTTLRIDATGRHDLVVDLLARQFRNVCNIHIDERLNISSVSCILPMAPATACFVLNILPDAAMAAIGDRFPKLEKLS